MTGPRVLASIYEGPALNDILKRYASIYRKKPWRNPQDGKINNNNIEETIMTTNDNNIEPVTNPNCNTPSS